MGNTIFDFRFSIKELGMTYSIRIWSLPTVAFFFETGISCKR
ncbi:hypothetical protein AVDCRST_MAG84-534 [uncultured Microcoleus sp.]|uniref:Uncharacterized protein n=1 Tax=uncultured Microcoleus sp. TaxID=259945 RepID=A0A6J4KJF7_9CYAN|nr:hypothetical protein AVDCRST_MAG84-534 [uncultured Microcoleus sp.]